jgi:solute carrier family 35 protein E1
MPHSTRASSATRVSNFKFLGDTNKPNMRSSMEQFPDHVEPTDAQSPYNYSASPTRNGKGYTNGAPSLDRWQPRRDSGVRGSAWGNGSTSTGGRGHDRQKSLSDALRTIRGRGGSVSANVHEIGDALKAPVSPRLVVRNPPSQNTNTMLIDGEICRFSALSGISRAHLRTRLPNPFSMPSLSQQPLQ